MATLRSLQFHEITGLTGTATQEFGDRSTFQELTVAGETYETTSIVADNFQEEILWAASGNVATFKVALFESDKDVILLLASAAFLATIQVPAGVRVAIGGSLIDQTALGGDGVANTEEDIVSITAKRNVADAVGDATVTMRLIL